METEPRHQCLIYAGSPLQQLPALAAVIRQRLGENYRCLYLNSPSMVSGMRSCLAEAGSNVAHEIARGSLVLSSDTAVAADGTFDADLMMRKIEDALDQAVRDGYKGLFATGDMTWEFGSQENFTQLLEYEFRLEKLFRKRHELCGICQYHGDTLSPEIMRKALVSHQRLFINETLSLINQHYISSEALAGQVAARSELDEVVAGLLKV